MDASIQLCMVLRPPLASVNTLLYGRDIMSDQLSAQDWLDQGLKALATNGVGALSAERVIAGLEAAAAHENPLLLLLRRTFSSRLALEKAVRSWAVFDVEARSAVQAIDRRRIDYIEGLLKAACYETDVAQARAQI